MINWSYLWFDFDAPFGFLQGLILVDDERVGCFYLAFIRPFFFFVNFIDWLIREIVNLAFVFGEVVECMIC